MVWIAWSSYAASYYMEVECRRRGFLHLYMALTAGVFEVEQATANYGIFPGESGSQHAQMTDGS
jgi:hypothetical protein